MAGRGRPRKTDNAELAQTDEALQSQLRECRTNNEDRLQKAKVASGANARYRSSIKAAITIGAGLGMTAEDVVWYVTSADRDPAEIDAETVRRNRIAKLMSMPLGSMLGLFDDQTSVATKVEDVKMATGDASMAGTEHEADIGGYKGYDLGMVEEDNPYPADDARNAAWLGGRNRRKGEVAQAASDALSRPHATPTTGKRGAKNGAAAASPAVF